MRVALEPGRDWEALLRAGMGVMFEVGDEEREDAPGGPIFAVRFDADGNRGAAVELSFGEPGPDLDRVREGDRVWLTGDPELQRSALRRGGHGAERADRARARGATAALAGRWW